jgi:hypothetical protein
MKNKSQSNNENKTTITLCWKTHLMQSDENSPDEILRQKHKNKKKENSKKKEQGCKVLYVRGGCWPNPNYKILTQKQGAQMKRKRTIRNKNKLAKCCIWEATAGLNPYCEIFRQK